MKNRTIMKNLLLLSLTFILILCLAACSDNTTTTVPDNTANSSTNSTNDSSSNPADATDVNNSNTDNNPNDTASVIPQENDSIDQESVQELIGILTDAAANYRAGVAGSSLVATEYAGKILDWGAAASNTAATATAAAQEFYATLSADQATNFPKQMQKIYESAQQLCGDNGADLLRSCGYSAQSYPWNQEDMETLFSAILSALA